MPKGKDFNFLDEIPEGFVMTREMKCGTANVREWRNPNLDPEERQRRIDDIGQFLWDFQCTKNKQGATV